MFLAVALPILAALLAPLPTVDLAYQLRAGAQMLAGQGIPSQDTWTFTATGLPWLDQQWGAQVILATVYSFAGWTGLALLRAGLVGLICALILLAVIRAAPDMNRRTAAMLTLAAFAVMSPALAMRPQLLGMALFAATLLILVRRHERPAWVWVLPVLSVAWANVHGSFILVPVLVGLAWLGDLVTRAPLARRMAVATAVTGLATLVTPFGLGVWRYAFGLATNQEVTARISEWQRPTLGSAFGALFWVSVVLVSIATVVLVRRRVRIPWVPVITLVAFVALGAIAERGIAWWPGVAAVTLAGMTVQPGARSTPNGGIVAAPRPAVAAPRPAVAAPRPARASVLNSAIGGALIVAGIALVPVWRPIDAGVDAPTHLLGQAPSGITEALLQVATPADRVWNPQVWGSWLEFAVPAPLYAFDTRIEVIPGDAWAQADRVEGAQADWSQVLDASRVSIVVTQGAPTAPLPEALAVSGQWRSLHTDQDGGIWVRSDR